jgi:nitrous oxide reductase accessory protein NosL
LYGLSDVNHRLRWDAATDQAGATRAFPFDNDRVESKLTCTDGGDIAAWPGANDKDVTGTLLHSEHLT